MHDLDTTSFSTETSSIMKKPPDNFRSKRFINFLAKVTKGREDCGGRKEEE